MAESQRTPDDEVAEMRRIYAETCNLNETARRTNRGIQTVRKYVLGHIAPSQAAKGKRPPADMAPPAMPPRLPENELLKSEAEAMQRAAVEGGFDDEEPLSSVWQREEAEAARKIRKASEASIFKWRAPGPHLLLSFASDQHIAPGTPVDFKAMREDAELIRATSNCYVILGGDGIDNHIKHRAAILAASSQPELQWKLFEYYLQILGDKALMMISGNHDNWTNAFAGVDYLGRIAKERRLCYAPDEAYMEIGVGTETYKVAVRHQFRMNSSFNQTHAVKQWLRLGVREFDIGCVGHHHEHAVESFLYRGKMCWGCRPGSYQFTSAYARAPGYNPSIPTTPTFLLRGDRREIVGFATLRAAIEFIRAAREIGVA